MELLGKLIKGRLAFFLSSVIVSGFATGVLLCWNRHLSGIIDSVSGGQGVPGDTFFPSLLLLLLIVASSYGKVLVLGYTAELMSHDLRMGYARYFAALSYEEVACLNVGESISKMQNEIDDVSKYLNSNLFALMEDGIRFLTTFLWLLTISPLLTASANLSILPILLYIIWSSKIISERTTQSQRAKTKMNGFADTLLSLFPMLRLYDAGSLLIGSYQASLQDWLSQTAKLERTKARLLSLSGLLSTIPLLLLFLIGGSMVVAGTLSIGTLYLFLNLSGNVSGVLMNMPGFISSYRQFAANAKRLSPKILIGKEHRI